MKHSKIISVVLVISIFAQSGTVPDCARHMD